MTTRILAIDDEERWLQNFQAWIPETIAIQDSASSSVRAAELLRKYHYDLIFLDLSMSVSDSFNRDNRPIQEYLAPRPEGTLYIVISGTAQKNDVRDAAFKLGAWDVIFKPEIDPAILVERVVRAAGEAGRHREQRIMEARAKLVKDRVHDSRILSTLQPRGGVSSMYSLMDTVLRTVAPIGQHCDRPYLAVTGKCVCGLLWSRLRGTAVSIVLANHNVKEEEALAEFGDWLGFAERGAKLFAREFHRVCMWVFEETSIRDRHFDLPLIRFGENE